MSAALHEAAPGRWARLRDPFIAGARQALQWRLLLLWLAALALPLLLAALPLWLALARLLDHALLARQLVDGYALPVLADALGGLGAQGYAPRSALVGAVVVYLLLLPWMTGMAVAAARSLPSPGRLGFGALLKGGLTEYGRMARLWLWALVLLGAAAGALAAALHVVQEQALEMTLESDALLLGRATVLLGGLVLLLVHATVDAARAHLVIEPRSRSVLRAWWRGTRGLLRRPLNFVLYAAITACGLTGAALLGGLRIPLAPAGLFGFLLALLLGQLLVAVLGWMRCARLFALVAAGRA